MRKIELDAVQYAFGMTKKEAREYIKNASPETITELVRGYKGDAQKAFYND